MPVGHLISSLDKCLLRSSVHFLIELFGFLLLSHMGSLYILGISPLSDIWFGNIFFYSVGFLFILLTVSCSLIVYFGFVASAFDIRFKNIIAKVCVKSLPLLSLSRFYIQVFIPFSVNLGVWCKLEAQIYSFDWGCTIFLIPFTNKTVFSLLYILGSFAVS